MCGSEGGGGRMMGWIEGHARGSDLLDSLEVYRNRLGLLGVDKNRQKVRCKILGS